MDFLPEVLTPYLAKGTAPISTFEVGGLLFTPSYLHAAAVVFLLFLLVLTFARLRRLYVNWSLRGSTTMVGLGFILAIILEGFLLLGGRTLFTEFLGMENAPKPVQVVIDSGRNRLVKVLGVNEEIPSSLAEEGATFETVVDGYQSLPPDDAEKFKVMLCSP